MQQGLPEAAGHYSNRPLNRKNWWTVVYRPHVMGLPNDTIYFSNITINAQPIL